MANSDDTTAQREAQEPSPSKRPKEVQLDQAGLCAEAQADGVPCTELGRQCEVCEVAYGATETEAW